jgi:NADH-quinone oxidoreductase subunit H
MSDLLTPETVNVILAVIAAFIKAFIIVNVLLVIFAYMTLTERKVMGRMQVRYGPNRVGPFGLLQPIADGIKLALKEDVTPSQANIWVHTVAPIMSLVPALIIFAVIPIGPSIPLGGGPGGQPWTWYIANINVAYLYVVAIASLGVYGIVLAGWASNNKYSLLGGLRASAQMISYELAQGLAALTVVVMAGSLSLYEIVEQQNRGLPFGLFPIVGWIAFIVYLIAGVAETNRSPFDLPEAEGELGAGFHTEYSGFKWSMFFMAEYVNMVNVSALAIVLFLGGWWPFDPQLPVLGAFAGILGPLAFIVKLALFMFFFIWLRSTLPRLRFDRLMALGWKVLLPVALANLVLTAIVVALWPLGMWPFA